MPVADPTLSDKDVVSYGYAKFESVSDEALDYQKDGDWLTIS